ncbi:MAG: signal peptidase II [Acidimicrobiales bacterium]
MTSEPAAGVDDVDTTAATDALPPRRLRLIGLVAVALVVADQGSKTWAQAALIDGPIHVLGSLRFNLLYNTGVAFSQGSGKGLGPWISLLALVVVVTVSLGAPSRTALGAVASGVISGGALGNLADRAFRGGDGFLHGAVIDFIDLQWWPVFNVADSAVVVGALLLVLASFRTPAQA